MHAYSLSLSSVKQNEPFASPRPWPTFFVYLYLIIQLVHLSWGCVVIIGFEKIYGRVLLAVVGILLPNAALYAFFVTLISEDNERRYPSMNVEIATFLGSGVICGLWNTVTISCHIWAHGNLHSLQPMEHYSDAGTSYFFLVFGVLTGSLIMLWNSAGMVYAYSEDIYKPCLITLHNDLIKKVE